LLLVSTYLSRAALCPAHAKPSQTEEIIFRSSLLP
jgi:hypothetical protein